jgi:hypothetical protein
LPVIEKLSIDRLVSLLFPPFRSVLMFASVSTSVWVVFLATVLQSIVLVGDPPFLPGVLTVPLREL